MAFGLYQAGLGLYWLASALAPSDPGGASPPQDRRPPSAAGTAQRSARGHRAPERARAPAVLGRPRWPTWVLPVNRRPECFAGSPWAVVPGRAGLKHRKWPPGTRIAPSLGYQIRPPDHLDLDPNSPEALPGQTGPAKRGLSKGKLNVGSPAARPVQSCARGA